MTVKMHDGVKAKIHPGDLGMAQRRYVRAYVGYCGAEIPGHEQFCEEHRQKRCSSCGEQATNECCHTGQFVCGSPLCNDCEGFEDRSRPSGSWGFLNHGHRRKPDAPPKDKLVPGDL